MASYHCPQPHHQCHPTTTTTSTVCYCCYCCPNYTPTQHHPPVPDPQPLPHRHHHPLQTNLYTPYPHGPNPNPPYTNQNLHYHHHQQRQYHPLPTDFEKEIHVQQELTQPHPMVSSLLRRISALESSLCHHHHSSSHSHSLRDAAARTIQTHFRAFLVRRSRTLRQLKDLASIKSTLNLLKSSVSKNPHFNPQSLSRKALNLLLKLDSVQGGDPMIRDGKKSIIRELNGFMDLIDDEVILKRSEISSRLVKKNVNKKSGGLHSDAKRGTVGTVVTRDIGKNKRLEDLVHRIDALYAKFPEEEEEEEVEYEDDLERPGISIIERNAVSRNRAGRLGKRLDGVEANVKKSVRFVENGKVYEVRRSRDYDSDDGSDAIGANNGEFMEDVQRKVEEVRGMSLKETEQDHSQDGESSKSSDGEGGQMYELRSEDGSFTFSAPLPVKMETRDDTMNRRKTIKIVE